jgi:hypothetical protein
MADTKYAPFNVVATYRSVDEARAAITALERSGGVEAGDIELLGAAGVGAPRTNEAQREVDLATTGAVAKRSGIGIITGAVIGAVIGFAGGYLVFEVFGLVDDMTAAGVAASTIAAAAAGALLGLFYGGASGLPVSDAWGETFETLPSDGTCVAVRTHERETAEAAVDALRSTGPARIARAGSDGRLQQVA